MDKNFTDTLFEAAADLAGAALLFYLLASVVLLIGVVLWAVLAALLWLGLFAFHALRAAWSCFSRKRAESRLTPPPSLG